MRGLSGEHKSTSVGDISEDNLTQGSRPRACHCGRVLASTGSSDGHNPQGCAPTHTHGGHLLYICSICGYVFCPLVVHQPQQVSVRAMVEWGIYSITTAVGVTDRLTEVSHTNIRLCHLSHTTISCQSTVLFRRLTLKLRCSVQNPPFQMMNKLNTTILRIVSLKIVS